jgi:hypothetical protein
MQQIEVRVEWQIDRDWSNWLVKPSVVHTAKGETLLTGIAQDQSAFYGLLSRLSSLGLQVVSLTCDGGDSSAGKEAREM